MPLHDGQRQNRIATVIQTNLKSLHSLDSRNRVDLAVFVGVVVLFGGFFVAYELGLTAGLIDWMYQHGFVDD